MGISRETRWRGAHLVMCWALATMLAACQSGQSSGGGTTELTLGTDAASRIQPVVDAFQKANSDIKIKVTESGQTSYSTFMQPQIAAGTAPDILRTYPGISGDPLSTSTLGQTGALVDLTKESWTSVLNTAQKSLYGQGGKVLAMPMGETAIGPVYNQTVLTQLGVSGAPQTWTDVMNLCQVAKAKGKVAYSIFQKGGSILTSFALSAPLVYGPNPAFNQQLRQGKASFVASGWVDVFQRQLDMLHAGCFQASPNGTDYNAAVNLVVTGKAAGIVLFTDISGLTAVAPAGTTFVMGPQPVDENTSDNYLSVEDAYGWGINAKSKHIDAARKFIAYLATPEAQNAFADAFGGSPSIPNSSFQGKSQTQQLLAQYVQSQHTGPFPNAEWPGSKALTALIDGSQNLFDGSESPSQVATDMDKGYKIDISGS